VAWRTGIGREGIRLSGLGPRRLSPAVESAADRRANLWSVCETYGVSEAAIVTLEGKGFRSYTQVALLDGYWLENHEVIRV